MFSIHLSFTVKQFWTKFIHSLYNKHHFVLKLRIVVYMNYTRTDNQLQISCTQSVHYKTQIRILSIIIFNEILIKLEAA